jgi:hypothetical protein
VLNLTTGEFQIVPGLELAPKTGAGLAFSPHGQWLLITINRGDHGHLLLVLRVAGTGDFSVVAVGPDGSRHEPTEVQEHYASNFERPGDEWGTWWNFDRAGCWRIVVDRGELKGVITLAVSP